MRSFLLEWLQTAWRVFALSSDLILWNSFLALIPLLLSVWLFRRACSRSGLWWLGAMVFLAFLPNAPYILTDIIHPINYIRQGYDTSLVILVLIPQYSLFLLVGFQAYVLSLLNLEYYFQKERIRKWIFPVNITLHFLCAIGVYLGRFLRFNSWDIIAQPDELITRFDDLLQKRPFAFTFLTFLIIWGLYELIKRIDRLLFPTLMGTHRKIP
jgi:uncharacterized membrane protein